DADRFALAYRGAGCRTRGERADDGELGGGRRRVRGAYGETVHGGVGKWRYRLGRDDVFGEHQTEGVIHRYSHRRAGTHPVEYVGASLFDRDHIADVIRCIWSHAFWPRGRRRAAT